MASVVEESMAVETQPSQKPEVGFDTSSKEPDMVKSRLFVGGINTTLITRDDIIDLFLTKGNLVGVSVFKGYAFIQYSAPSEADAAVNELNGYDFKGSKLDVKHINLGAKPHNASAAISSSNGNISSGNWPSNNWPTSGFGDGAFFAAGSYGVGNISKGASDAMSCGKCGFATSNLEKFLAHRLTQCSLTIGNSTYPSGGTDTGLSAANFPSNNVQTSRHPEVGLDTNSKEPRLVKSRLFVGNLDTSMMGRDDVIELFGCYGRLLAVTIFKGFAFVQYSAPPEALYAANELNGYNWNGSVLDIKLATLGAKSQGASEEASPGSKRRAEDEMVDVGSKRRMTEISVIKVQNEKNRQLAKNDDTTNSALQRWENSDTMICGKCRFITYDYERFRSHLLSACKDDDGAAIEIDEPKQLWQCALCEGMCNGASDLIFHVVNQHNIYLLKTNQSDQ